MTEYVRGKLEAPGPSDTPPDAGGGPETPTEATDEQQGWPYPRCRRAAGARTGGAELVAEGV